MNTWTGVKLQMQVVLCASQGRGQTCGLRGSRPCSPGWSQSGISCVISAHLLLPPCPPISFSFSRPLHPTHLPYPTDSNATMSAEAIMISPKACLFVRPSSSLPSACRPFGADSDPSFPPSRWAGHGRHPDRLFPCRRIRLDPHARRRRERAWTIPFYRPASYPQVGSCSFRFPPLSLSYVRP